VAENGRVVTLGMVPIWRCHAGYPVAPGVALTSDSPHCVTPVSKAWCPVGGYYETRRQKRGARRLNHRAAGRGMRSFLL